MLSWIIKKVKCRFNCSYNIDDLHDIEVIKVIKMMYDIENVDIEKIGKILTKPTVRMKLKMEQHIDSSSDEI
jgi:hypothetical protein